MRDLPRRLVGFKQLAIFGDTRQPQIGQPVIQPRADHLLLFLPQLDAALVVDQLPEVLKIRVSDLHDMRGKLILYRCDALKC